MLNFNGGTTISGASLTPLGMYAGYLLLQSGNFWLALSFLALTILYFLIVITTLCRYVINYCRNKNLLHYQEKEHDMLSVAKELRSIS